MCGDAPRVGLYGFGAAAHIVAQVLRWQGREVYAFTRPGDTAAQDLARELGAAWAGGSDERPPEELDAAIVFAPVGALVPQALSVLAPGGTVVLRRDPHERHTRDALRAPLARALGALGRQPDAPRRRGVPRDRGARAACAPT